MLRQSRWSVIAGIVASMSLVVVILFTFLQAQVLQAEVNQDILYVALGGDCGAAAPCFDNVQAAVDAAADGDEIRIATGTYTGTHSHPTPPGYPNPGPNGVITQSIYITKSLTIRGGYAVNNWSTSNPHINPTVLDAEREGRVMVIAGAITATVEGLEIMGGSYAKQHGGGAPYYGTHDAGGGIYVFLAIVTIKQNRIVNNRPNLLCGTGDGSGIALVNAQGTILQNHFEDNIAHLGGAISSANSEILIENNVFNHNIARTLCWIGEGGALNVYNYTGSTTLIRKNIFNFNEADNQGGAIDLFGEVIMEGNIFMNNSARLGGGLFIDTVPTSVIQANLFINNRADETGGGIRINVSEGGLFVNNVIANNHVSATTGYGSGIYVRASDISLTHNTIYNNSGGDGSGVYSTELSLITMTNMIIADQYLGIHLADGRESLTIRGILWFDNFQNVYGGPYTVTNAFEGDPLFMADGYHITPGSAAIDRGVSTFVTEDIDGTPRPAGVAPDLGADEFPELTEWFYLPVLAFPQ